MILRLAGAALLVAGSGGFAFSLAYATRREIKMLHNLVHAIQEMEWELKYRMTELPELLCTAANAAGSPLREIFLELSGKLIRREAEDISGSMNAILNHRELPRRVRSNLAHLGQSLGRYDLEGQLLGLQDVRIQCRKDYHMLEENSSQRLHNYQTLALCAGAGLAILLV